MPVSHAMDDNKLRGTRAAGILYRVGGEILLLKRADNAGDYPGHWCFPGGRIEEGETPEQAARRESMEEIGYTPNGEVRQVVEYDGFVTFSHSCEKFQPVLDSEHSGYVWAHPERLPDPIHPGVVFALKSNAAMDESARQMDVFGWMTIEDNPISKVGVFPYLGSQIGAPNPTQIYMVYRPESELNNPETIESFKLTPFINEHPKALLGNTGKLVSTDSKRVDGVFGEKVYFEYPYLKANLRVYSAQALDSLELGKEELSAGYNFKSLPESGTFEGQDYQYVQRFIRGNHGALVESGRSGPDVSVMDGMTFVLDSKELKMAGEIEAAGELDLAGVVAALKTIGPQVSALMEFMYGMKPKDAVITPGAMDDDEEAKKKKEEEDKEKEKSGMDSALKIKALEAKIAAMEAKPAMDSGAIMADMSKKNDLVNRVSAHIGTFACEAMDHKQVAEYAADKLGLDKDHAVIAVESFLKARPAAANAYGMDSAADKSTGKAFLAEQYK